MYFMEEENDVHKLYIYDNITAKGKFNWETWEYGDSETSAKHFAKILEDIPETATLELHINSYGGEVKEGVAIYNLIKNKVCKEKVCYVDGFACSAATLPVMAVDKGKRIMGVGTYMLVHNMWTTIAGNADELRKAADDLDQLMKANRQIYLERSNISEEDLIELMKQEKYLTPEECLEYGFCDEISKEEKETEKNELINQLATLQQQAANNKFLNAVATVHIEDVKERLGLKNVSKLQQNKKEEELTKTNLEESVLNSMSAFFESFSK